MISLIKDIWNWLTNQALQQLLVLALVSILCFVVLLKYPIEFERTTYKNKQNINITETTQYVMSSDLTEKGAKLSLITRVFYVEVSKNE